MRKRSGFTLLEVALSLPLLLLVLWNTNRIAEAIANGIEQQREKWDRTIELGQCTALARSNAMFFLSFQSGLTHSSKV